MRWLAAGAAVLALSAALLAVPQAGAQARCPEGRLANGRCVNPELARDLRTGTVVLTQQKLSLTNPPVLPSQDGDYAIPRDHHDIANLHGSPPVTSVFGPIVGGGAVPVFTGPRP